MEFLIVIIPLITLFLCLIQLALVMGAGILTQHGAQKAVRAAIVVLSDDHEAANYKEPLNSVGSGAKGVGAYRNATKDGRYETIRMAARLSLAPVSPTWQALSSDTVRSALSQGVDVGMLLSLAGWTKYGVGLGFLDFNENYISSFSPIDDIRVELIFLYPCTVPVGRELLCRSYQNLSEHDRTLIETNGRIIGWSRFSDRRFVALRAIAALPNQGRR